MLTARPWSDPRYVEAARLATRQAGLTLKAVRRPAVESGIRRAMERADVLDIGEYINLLEAEPMALDDLVTELTVGETYFFREPGHFEFLRREVLPDIRRRRGSGHTLRVWSAGCSTGEEAYSLAIVLEQEGLSEQAYLLGTDIPRGARSKPRAWPDTASGRFVGPTRRCRELTSGASATRHWSGVTNSSSRRGFAGGSTSNTSTSRWTRTPRSGRARGGWTSSFVATCSFTLTRTRTYRGSRGDRRTARGAAQKSCGAIRV